MSDALIEALIEGFVEESAEICEQITRDLLGLEQDTSADAIRAHMDRIARGLHTLKGTSATVGLDDLSAVAHAMEDLIAPAKKAGVTLQSATVDVLLRGLDGFMERVRARGARKEMASTAPLLEALTRAQLSPFEQDDLGDVVVGTPSISAWSPNEPIVTEPTPSPLPAAVEQEAEAPADDEAAWRVRSRDLFALTHEIERIRDLRLRMDRRYRELARVLDRALPATLAPEIREELFVLARSLKSDAVEAADVVETTETAVRALATVPVSTMVEPMRRSVRDICRQLNKEARLSVVGGELAIDRRVLEALRGPVLHLVRNAVSHGIELPEVRERAGKHPEGAVIIRLEQRGNLLELTVEDDGRGLDAARIREEAFLRGLLRDAQEELSQERIHELIFQPGFSTSGQVTSASGRGVGLDVVRAEVLALGGEVEVQSVRGQGARFRLSIPIEFGSSPLLVFRCGEHLLALPLLTIASVRSLRADDVRGGASRPRLFVDQEAIPLYRAGVLLGLELDGPSSGNRPVLIVQSRGRRIALVVDEIIGDRDLVIRGLPPELRDMTAYQGAATLAEGELLLVLRADWLASQSERPHDASRSGQRALVVDDSLTARALHRTVLESGGFVVHTAAEGRAALERLATDTYDLVVCDIGMEGMDGIALTREIRSRPQLRRIPIILVSAHDAEQERQRGLAAGADAFLGKKECVSGRLLSEAAGIIGRRRAS